MIIHIVLQFSVRRKYLFKKKTVATPNVEKECWALYETDDEILPVFAHVLWTFKFIFSGFHGNLFSVLLEAVIYVFIVKKM